MQGWLLGLTGASRSCLPVEPLQHRCIIFKLLSSWIFLLRSWLLEGAFSQLTYKIPQEHCWHLVFSPGWFAMKFWSIIVAGKVLPGDYLKAPKPPAGPQRLPWVLQTEPGCSLWPLEGTHAPWLASPSAVGLQMTPGLPWPPDPGGSYKPMFLPSFNHLPNLFLQRSECLAAAGPQSPGSWLAQETRPSNAVFCC